MQAYYTEGIVLDFTRLHPAIQASTENITLKYGWRHLKKPVFLYYSNSVKAAVIGTLEILNQATFSVFLSVCTKIHGACSTAERVRGALCINFHLPIEFFAL